MGFENIKLYVVAAAMLGVLFAAAAAISATPPGIVTTPLPTPGVAAPVTTYNCIRVNVPNPPIPQGYLQLVCQITSVPPTPPAPTAPVPAPK